MKRQPRFGFVLGALLLAIVLGGGLWQPGLPTSPATVAARVDAQPGQIFTIGTSVQGQPITGYRLGTGSRSIVLVGAIHGDERNSGVLAGDLYAAFSNTLHLLPPDTSLYVIERLNPDGYDANSRYNANGVDLNRNWQTDDWSTDSQDASGVVRGGGGAYPFSEPESRAMAEWLLTLRDNSTDVIAVFYHSQYPPDGFVLGGSTGRPITAAYADIVGYRGGWSNSGGGGAGFGYRTTGEAPGWCRANSLKCFEIELPNRRNLTAPQTARHYTAVLAVLLWQQVEQGQQCFGETGMCVAGRMRDFWREQGGTATFGLPLTTPVLMEVDGAQRTVQWFERGRLELHPEIPAPNDVKAGRIGVEWLEAQGRSWWAFEPASDEMIARPDCLYFAETRHTLCAQALAAWQSRGLELDGQSGYSRDESIALLGMPVSEPVLELLPDGREVIVQWLERGRLEWAMDEPDNVQVGMLGTEIVQATRAQ